jgi:hypothetical protein
MRRILPVFLACMALGAQSPKVKVWVGIRPPAVENKDSKPISTAEGDAFRIPVFLPRDERGSKPGRMPGTVVEVWGDASWVRQDEFKAFLRTNLPAFRTAFDVGQGSSIGGQMLSELMSSPGDLHRNPAPAMAPTVWYNAQDPWARNKRFY